MAALCDAKERSKKLDIALTKFWIKRFLQFTVILAIVLAISEYIKAGSWDVDIQGIAIWSISIGLFVATVSSIWAYKKKCKLAYKD